MKVLHGRGVLLLLVIALLVSMMPAALAAQTGSAAISASSAEGKAEELVEITISVSENQGISGAGLQLDYDKNALELVEIESARGNEYFEAKTTSGKLSWLKGSDVTGSFTLATVRFRIRSGTADGSYPVQLSLIDNAEKNLVNASRECVAPKFTSGSVTVKSSSSEDDSGKDDTQKDDTQKDDTKKTVIPIVIPDGGSRFSDVPSDRWSAEYIEYLAERGIIDGIGGGLFGPKNNVTRAQFVKMIAGVAGADVRGMQTTQFKDVRIGDWFAPYVAWATAQGIVKGISADSFAPNAYVTREQMAAMIYRYVSSCGSALPATSAKRTFTDEASFSTYAVDAIYAMQQSGIINGKSGGAFAPKDHTTREEAAKMLALTHQILFE